MHPFFVKVAEYQKKVTVLTRSESSVDREEATRLTREVPPELIQEAERLHDAMKAAGKLRHQASLSTYGAEGYPPGSVIPYERYIFHWLCFFKYGKTAEHLVQEYESGSLKAAKQIHKLSLEYDKWRFGQLDPNKIRFKTDLDHFDLMSFGLDLGLENLTPIELGDCFDDVCPCGKLHFPEHLSKLRTRIVKDFPPNP